MPVLSPVLLNFDAEKCHFYCNTLLLFARFVKYTFNLWSNSLLLIVKINSRFAFFIDSFVNFNVSYVFNQKEVTTTTTKKQRMQRQTKKDV